MIYKILFTISAKTGKIILAIATFEVNSVRNSQIITTIKRITAGDKAESPLSEFPINSDIFEALLPSAKANPPPTKALRILLYKKQQFFKVYSNYIPSKNRRPHGILSFKIFHVTTPGLGFCGRSFTEISQKNNIKIMQ